ncbi:helix-turn-helix domain-containing protein [Streptomyces sp. NPDC051658]|uniref:helix-turn-helix domain-containing protein n=1 Tax=unclassified Streptomyces TaxID=2593676 RepID=UPI0033E9C4FF
MTDMLQAVDALLRRPADLPPPHLRASLRKADQLTQAQVAEVLNVTPLAVLRWENGQSEPRGVRRKAYARLMRGLAEKHPTVAPDFAASLAG